MLYGVTAVMFGLLGAVEVVTAPSAVRTALRCVIVLGGFAAMAVWVRFNRVALDQQEWCTCAATTITVRVIQSRRPARLTAVSPHSAAWSRQLVSPHGERLHCEQHIVEDDRERVLSTDSRR